MLRPQSDGGEGLAELVVQLTSDPESLRLLGGKDAPGTYAPFGLQPPEHLVERVREGQYLAAGTLEPDGTLAGMQQIDLSHDTGEPIERPKRLAKEHKVDHQHHDEARHQENELLEPDRRMKCHRGEREEGERQSKHRSVCREHTPQHRRWPATGRRRTILGRGSQPCSGPSRRRRRDIEVIVTGHRVAVALLRRGVR